MEGCGLLMTWGVGVVLIAPHIFFSPLGRLCLSVARAHGYGHGRGVDRTHNTSTSYVGKKHDNVYKFSEIGVARPY